MRASWTATGSGHGWRRCRVATCSRKKQGHDDANHCQHEEIPVPLGEDYPEIREGVSRICADFPGSYWRDLDERRVYPDAFVKALTEAYTELAAAEMMVRKATALFAAGAPCGEDANIAKLLASEAAWHAGEACLQTHGGFGFATEYDVERKWREVRVTQVAPVSTNLILANIAEHTLGMPRSF